MEHIFISQLIFVQFLFNFYTSTNISIRSVLLIDLLKEVDFQICYIASFVSPTHLLHYKKSTMDYYFKYNELNHANFDTSFVFFIILLI
uniref:Uncharacterized protein n=1 Tax=Strongyloides papillosus TaxID=174720 RepID=A0A0N5B2W7_STREA